MKSINVTLVFAPEEAARNKNAENNAADGVAVQPSM
jgi:hypothetical protein